MRGFNTKKAQSCKDGGLIRGPGTGTSDSIPDKMRPGSFIMPADSTQSLGAKALSSLGKKVPVNVSNGEYEYTPEQVHAVGLRALSQLKDATHTPVQGPASGSAERGFAPQHLDDGGGVFGSRGLSQLRDTIPKMQAMGYPQNPAQPPAFSTPAQRQPASFGDAAAAQRDPGVTQVGAAPAVAQPTAPAPDGTGLAAAAFPNTTRAIGGAMDDARSAYQQGGLGAALGQSARVMGAPLIGLADDVATGAKTVLNPAAQALKTFATGDATPIGQDPQTQTTPATPVALTPTPGALTDVQRGGGSAPAMPDATPAPGAAAALQTMPGVYNHGRGQYSDSASGMGMPTSFTGQPNSQNMAAADSLAARGFTPNSMPSATSNPTRGFSPPTIANSTNNWQAANDLRNARVSASSITANGGRFDQTRKGQMSPQAATYAAMLETDQALQKAQPGMAKAAMDANAGLQREGMQQTGATQRAGLGFQTAQQRLAMDKETQGIANRGKTLVQGLQEQIAAEQDPAKRQSIVERLRQVQGGQTADPYLVVPGGQQIDANSGKSYNTPSAVFNRQSGQFLQQPEKGGTNPYADGQRLQGKDGKSYVVKNGVPVLQ